MPSFIKVPNVPKILQRGLGDSAIEEVSMRASTPFANIIVAVACASISKLHVSGE